MSRSWIRALCMSLHGVSPPGSTSHSTSLSTSSVTITRRPPCHARSTHFQ